MKRGEIWTLHADGYAGKPRPVVIVQSGDMMLFQSVVTCLITSYDSAAIPTRVRIEPADSNGLKKPSWVMTEKIVTVNQDLLGKRIGELPSEAMREMGRQIAHVLGIA